MPSKIVELRTDGKDVILNVKQKKVVHRSAQISPILLIKPRVN